MLNYRLMNLHDIDAIVEIEQEAFTAPWSAEAFRNELTNNLFAKYMIMESDNDIIGYGGMWLIIDEAHVTNIAVRTQFQGKGYGRSLLTEMMKTAYFLGARRMTLEVRVSNERAQSLYRKMGFSPSGVRPAYYSDNMEDALIMWADLGTDDADNPEFAEASEGEQA
ncbi:ribosomal protein S18-alanine N-acetyltransferase [Cohnella cholangitidis]|uniref:Ribosomal-protein-alanine N-acetyltransferase n=1 Tax=Cohnella cholangitidis TaxID=2598458 RepID=A0A7G5C222_9BACL|nr:ribosomal protein S18-alanine N-acetyltransferase [Cohnella cholangitidis]QMV43256.1 ribosomal-protein-alanine N-acetyltransferase [Cohnella cholangitidis]